MSREESIMWNCLMEPIYRERVLRTELINEILIKLRIFQEISIEKEVKLLCHYHRWKIEDLEILIEKLNIEISKKINNNLNLN